LLAFFRRLIGLRREHDALATGARRVVHLDDAAGTYAYVRKTDHDRVAVVFNIGLEPCTLRLHLPEFPASAKDRLNSNPVAVAGDFVEVYCASGAGAFVA
jgi:glycosidase